MTPTTDERQTGFEPGASEPARDEFEVRDPLWQELLEDAALYGLAAAGVGCRALFGRLAGNTPAIITYHRVSPNIKGLPAPLHNVTPTRFRRQLNGLLRRDFVPWSLDQLLEHRDKPERIPERVFAVTFDDGFETVYSQAWPVLREFKIPATVFISTAYIDRDEPFRFDAWGVRHANEAPAESYRPLSWKQCHEMVDSGLIQVGAHTHTHQDFRGRPDDFGVDVRTSVEIVRQHFGEKAIPFAFPFGSSRRGHAGPELVAAAKQAGVSCGLTTDPILLDVCSDPFTWGRFNAFAWDTGATLAAKLDGWYSWAPKLKRRVEGTLNHIFASILPASTKK